MEAMAIISPVTNLIAKKPLKTFASAPRTWQGVSCAALAERYASQRWFSETTVVPQISPETKTEAGYQRRFHVRKRIEKPAR
jgi:hypothetical protein